MKILKIRGRNLASLYGNFELDFTAAPLAGCGLFTITGETGAGKSTILDAMCLALYGRFPRIMGEGPKDRVENSRGESLQTNDPRSILRTGSPEAFAQVDLMVGDKQLRASWRVRRAYGKAQGNLLDFERSLTDLADGSVLASGKKRVDEEISRRLKLTYEQFGRTVLLAQNDFDAFLRANDGDRADLLEKITGTELYSKISARAYEIERNAQRDLADLQRETGFIKVLPSDQRAELCALIKSSEQDQQKLLQRAHKARAGIDWYMRHDEARLRVEVAQKRAVMALEELEENVDKKQLLVKIDLATGLQPVIDKVAEGERAIKVLAEEQSDRIRQQEDLQGQLVGTDKQVDERAKRFVQAEKKLQAALPDFEQALKLDTQINTHSQRYAKTKTTRERAQNNLADLQKQDEESRALSTQMTKQMSALSLVLDKNFAMEALSVRSKDLAVLFLRLGDLRAGVDEANAKIAQKKQSYSSLQGRMKNDEFVRKILLEQLAKAKDQRDENASALSQAKPHEVRLTRDQQIDTQNQLNLLLNHLTVLVEHTTAIENISRGRTEAAKEISALQKNLERLERDLRVLKSRADEAGDLLQRSKTVLSKHVLSLRAGLLDDEACPVCGSPDHPGHDDKALSALLEEMRQRASELAREIAQSEQQRTQTGRSLEQYRARAQNADERLEDLENKIDKLKPETTLLYANLNQAAKPLGLKIAKKRQLDKQLSTIKQVLESHQHHGVTLQKRLMAIQQLEVQNRSCEEKVLSLEQAVQEKMQVVGKLEDGLKIALDELQQSRAGLARAKDRQKNALEQLHTLLVDIDVSKYDLERDAKSAELFLQRAVERHDQQKRQLADIGKALVERQAQDLLRAQTLKQQAFRLVELENELAEARDYLGVRKQRRAKLFDGNLIAQVRGEMEESLHQASKALKDATAAKHQTATRLEEVEKTLTRLKGLLKKARQVQEDTLKARNNALNARKLSLEETVSLLGISIERREQMVALMEKLSSAKTSTAALLVDHMQHLSEIEKQPMPDSSKEKLRELLREIEAERAMAMIELGKNNSRLELDDTALAQRASLSGKMAKVESNHALWAVVSGAIGSKNGAKFRQFAQGVTLDHLIALANQQLRNINPRYKMERNMVGGLGLQVVDEEMGGEVRSVRSLSGGERFLVSLALALGLSQLDGRSSFVDTLMIDEGFGALDARSLDIVIEALESLQSQGRKVGVISHIEALTDRIPVQIKVEKQGNGRSAVRVVEHGMMGEK